MRILIAEDDSNLGPGIVELFELEGLDCHLSTNGTDALAQFVTASKNDKPFEFCVLDVLMPGMDGFALCKEIRTLDKDIPILFLTARGEEYERLLGFDLGADDYVLKPFSTKELLARIKAIARRRHPPSPQTAPILDRFVMADLTIDRHALRAFRGEVSIDLSPREALLLQVLYERAGLAVPRDELFYLCWGRDYMPNSRSLDQYVSALRYKIETDPATPRIIRTVHGVGYRYDLT